MGDAESEPRFELPPAELAELLERDRVQVVDLRPTGGAQDSIEGARRVAPADLAAEAMTFDRERPIAFCDEDGDGAPDAAAAFREAGFTAYALAGGLRSWREAGLPLESTA